MVFQQAIGRRPRYSLRRIVGMTLFGLLMVVASLVLAMLLSLSVTIIDMALVGLIAGTILLFLPINWLIFLFLILVFFVVGQLTYFASIQTALWIPYIFSFLFYIRLPVEMMRLRQEEIKQRRGEIPLSDSHRAHSTVMTAFLFYVFVIVVSTAFNRPPVLQTFIGVRSYLFLWSIMLILGFGTSDATLFDRLWRFFVFVAFFQFPFALFQAVYVVQYLGKPWDAITGTFGGYMSGVGGGSGAMAVFLLVVLTYGLVMWRDGFWSFRRIATYFIAMMAIVLMAEIKIVVVLMPLIVLMVLWKKIFFRPLQGILIVMGLGIAFLGTLYVYQQVHWGKSLGLERESSWRGRIEMTLDYLFAMEGDVDFINERSGEVGRISALNIWYKEHRTSYDTVHALIGHGPAASRVGSLMGMGTAAERYHFNLGTHSASRLLWDFGLLGLLSFIFLLLAGAYRARALRKSEFVPPRTRSTFSAVSIVLVLEVLLLIYQYHLVDISMNQTCLAVLLGQIIYWELAVQKLKKQATSSNKRNPASAETVGPASTLSARGSL